MIPFSEVRVLDRNSEALGVPPSTLMDNAGSGVARAVIDEFSPRRALVICGSGNNGGDGYVAARRLAEEGVGVALLPVREPSTDLARAAAGRLPSDVERIALSDLDLEVGATDVVIDAMLGVGVSGPLREPYGDIVRLLNRSGVPVVSVDVPTGMGSDEPLEPALVLTFHDIKEGMEDLPNVRVIDIGIPVRASTHTGPGELNLIPRRPEDAHKGHAGRVLVVGGGPFTGAPALVAMAALRTGSDLTVAAIPEAIAHVVAGFSPDLIVRPVPGDRLAPEGIECVIAMLDGADAAVIGPGLGDAPETLRAVMTFVEAAGDRGVPLVVDADALKVLTSFPDADLTGTGVLTPHRGEMARLAGGDDLERGAVDLSTRTGFAVLLKGPEDLIVRGERRKRNATGNLGMTVGGTGDVLAGAVGALLGMGLDPFDAARVGAYLVGRAGDLAHERYGVSLLATDVIARLPDALREV